MANRFIQSLLRPRSVSILSAGLLTALVACNRAPEVGQPQIDTSPIGIGTAASNGAAAAPSATDQAALDAENAANVAMNAATAAAAVSSDTPTDQSGQALPQGPTAPDGSSPGTDQAPTASQSQETSPQTQ